MDSPSQFDDVYRALSKNAGEVVCLYDPNQGQETWLSELSEHLGMPDGIPSPSIRNLIDYISEPDRLLFEKEWSKLSTQQRLDFQCRFQTYKGRRVWHRITTIPYTDSTGTAWVAIAIRDVDRFERMRVQQTEDTRIQAIQSMTAGLSHEFNNHLTPIGGFIELTIETLGESELASDLGAALEKVKECADLIKHVQSYGGNAVLQPRSTEIGRITGSIIRNILTNEEEAGHGIKVHEEVDPDLPMIMLDHNAYRQVLKNLVQNSLEAIEGEGSISIRIRAEKLDPVSKRPTDEAGQGSAFIRLRMIDSGEGISAMDLNRVFDPFYTTRDRAQKRGIGLSVAQGIVRQHGGWMDIHSTCGVGTAVTLFFPCFEKNIPVEADTKGIQLTEHEQKDEVPRVRRAAPVGRVLVGDDDDVIRQMVCKVFAREGWIVEEAHDYHEVLDIAERSNQGPTPFSLFILDIRMPGPASTEENLAHLQRLINGSKILLMSGVSRDADIDRLVNEYDSDFVKKPFSPRALMEVVDDLMLEHN